MGIDYVLQKEVEQDGQPHLAFVSKHPHNTWWVFLMFNLKNKPQALLDDLTAIGWEANSNFPPPIPIKGIQHLDIGIHGSGLFGDWTTGEKRKNLRLVKAVLSKHGFQNVPHYKLTLSDML